MANTDKDYRLSHEQLIKVCKVLLHKLNCVDYKNTEGKEQQNQLARELYKQAEKNTQYQMEELGQLVHTVHSDFEKYLKKHKQEHGELSLKVVKLSEVGHKTLDSMDEIKASIEKQATILTCLLEFSSIEQALKYHEEAEKIRISAVGIQNQKESKVKRQGSDSKRSVGGHGNNFFPTYQH